MVDRKFGDFEVVIASRGIERLANNLILVNQSTVLPRSVIWCLPNDFVDTDLHLSTFEYAFEVVLVKSRKKGQVHQRCFGISQVTTEYVIFMDDDIKFGNCLFERLLQHAEIHDPCVVAPLIFNLNHIQLYRKPSKIKKIIDLIFHGFPLMSERSGKIGHSGFPKYIDPKEFETSPFEVEWLPGGVQLIKKSLFPTDNYYPHEGKAYCEDLYLSEVYKKKRLKMFVLPFNVYTEVVPLQSDFRSMWFDYKARLHFVLITKRSLTRMILWYLCLLISRFLRF